VRPQRAHAAYTPAHIPHRRGAPKRHSPYSGAPPPTAARTLEPSLARIATDSRTVKDKAQHAVVLEKSVNDRLQKDVQSYRLITVATLVDRLKINGSLARQALNDLEANGQIKKVVGHSKLNIYSM
jgi:small subunit ribosomal protein S25e